MAASRPVLHLPVIAAVCTGVYAGSLAGVAGLQATQESALAEARQPLLDAAARGREASASTAEAVGRANDALAAASERYSAVMQTSGDLDGALGRLTEQVAEISGAAAQLRTSVALPAAGGSVSMVSAPATQATTGASGQ